MLSEKLTLSLRSIAVLIAFGLVCFAPSAFADGDAGKTHLDVSVKISAAESMIDVSYEGDDNDIQIASGRSRESRNLTEGDALAITLLVEFSHVVPLSTAADDPGGHFGADDILVKAFDKEGRFIDELKLSAVSNIEDDEKPKFITRFRDFEKPGQQYLVQIDEEELIKLEEAFEAIHGGSKEIHSLVFYMPAGIPKAGTPLSVTRGVRKTDLAHAFTHFDPDGAGDGKPHQHLNKQSNLFRVDLVDDDEGEAQYPTSLIDPTADANMSGEGVPGVVTIDRVQERSHFVETGPFEVSIILTEDPRGGLTTDLVLVEGGGSATNVIKGATLNGAITISGQERASELTHAIASFTPHSAGGGEGEDVDLPEATGRDNKYHRYFVTITPDSGVDGDLTISVKQFPDNVKPISNMYVPLTREQRIAVTLTDTSSTARDARVANETLDVPVQTSADTTSSKVVATAAYKARQEGVLDKVGNEIQLANKAYIPAGGYLVLAADLGKAGIAGSSAKLKEKLTAASQLYNTMGLGLPFPADDLDNFVRNGGTLNLGYADIPEATGSGHDDAKAVAAAGHNDNTGYAGATTNAYTTGALIINEIMWGINGGADPVTGSQYIELHNPGTTAITIDSKEWVITVGSLPPGYTAIDTFSNNPASGYWEVPGNGGVTTASPAHPTVIDLVSMSRVAGGADGTAAASWAASVRPSANLSGRRIGTPGAANNYVMPAPEPAPEPEPAAPAIPVAEADDITISEVMVASDEGRLPQWIELANVSGAAVSLSGWSLTVENDTTDDSVIGNSFEFDLGDVEIAADQVVLVVSKEGRNSGVDTAGAPRTAGDGSAGDFDADRIINIQSMVSPNNARYSLISEMGFTLSLLPPRTGAKTEFGDVVGNLEKGWDLPVSEEGRSSLIRREMGDAGEHMGTDAAGWVLASDTDLDGLYRTTYYGSDEDMGTPGYNAGGALPVDFSSFGAKRDRLTGQVVITWETQSELNNAGYFIKRSEEKNGKFVVVNPTMIAGAGTTAEKQSYTYTDTSAKPNVVYYYQIEDVSLDGNRQTLTRAHRLKGHLSPVGNKTTVWGELKSQE